MIQEDSITLLPTCVLSRRMLIRAGLRGSAGKFRAAFFDRVT